MQDKYRFWIRATACIAVAALVVKQLKLVEFSTDRIVNWLIGRLNHGKKGKRGEFAAGDWAADAVADFILCENINFLIIATQWKKGGPRIRPVREPRGKLSGCYAIAERRLLLAVSALRSYAIENEIPFREWIEILQRRGAASQIDRRTLTAGTDVPEAQM